MSISFRSLNNSTPEEIRHCFNESFKDYFIPFQLSTDQFKNKIATEAIDLSLSFGVFDNNLLVGFILNGIDTIDGINTAYNAGTGVLPEYRGKGLSFSLYEFCIDELRNAGIKRSVLEVFQQNTAAIKTYQKAGLAITRTINSYKGKPVVDENPGIKIKEIKAPDWNWINNIAAWKPAWQYNHHTLQRGWHQYQLFVAYEKEAPAAFVIFNPVTGRAALFGAEPSVDSSAYLSALFAHIYKLYNLEFTVVHVDPAAIEKFLFSLGLQPFIYSYEMERVI